MLRPAYSAERDGKRVMSVYRLHRDRNLRLANAPGNSSDTGGELIRRFAGSMQDSRLLRR